LANVDFKTREVKPEHRTLTLLRIGTSGAIQPDIPIGSFIFSEISVGCDGLLNWYADRDKINISEMEDAFKVHTHWNSYLGSPYFVKAGDKLIEAFKDCTVRGVTISAQGFYGPQGRVVRLPLAMPDTVMETNSLDSCLNSFSSRNSPTISTRPGSPTRITLSASSSGFR